MPDGRKEAIRRFLSDSEMSKAVHSVLLRQFLKAPKERDVQFLAASWLAKDLFDEAWKELSRLKSETVNDEKPSGNPGL